MYSGVAVQGFITHPARTSIKVLIELFQKFAGRGQRPRRDPQIAKLPSVQFREEKGLGKAPLSIWNADIEVLRHNISDASSEVRWRFY